jgi:hypothetical protein
MLNMAVHIVTTVRANKQAKCTDFETRISYKYHSQIPVIYNSKLTACITKSDRFVCVSLSSFSQARQPAFAFTDAMEEAHCMCGQDVGFCNVKARGKIVTIGQGRTMFHLLLVPIPHQSPAPPNVFPLIL